MTLPIGLGIGRLVFRALNACEVVLAAAMVACFVIRPPTGAAGIAAGVAVIVLLAQVLAVRPALTRRSEATLAGAEVPRSRAHGVYVGLEIIKVVALLVAGALLIAA